jgi:uncharacterized protein with ParB-like and HNH nuclease domain
VFPCSKFAEEPKLEAKTIENVFTDAIFRVPGYQRGYAWEESHLEDFWRDLSWLSENQRHYTGMLTLYKTRDLGGRAVYHIVDGQQRITTSFLLISKLAARNEVLAGLPRQVIEYCYLRSVDPKNGSLTSRVGYESEERMNFLQAILDDRSAVPKKRRKLTPKNVYEKNLLRASDFFDEKLKGLSPLQMSDLFAKVKNQLIFDVHYVRDASEVSSMFESINYRGKRLTKFEVLKNRLIFLCQLIGQADEGVRSSAMDTHKLIEDTWGEAFDWFGRGEDPLDEDDFLLHHTCMYFGSLKRERDALDKFLFKEKFATDRLSSVDDDRITLGELTRYVESIRVSSELWALQNARIDQLVGKPKWVTKDFIQGIRRLNRLRMRHFKPLILGALNRMRAGDTNEDSTTLVHLLSRVERFIFLVYSVSGYGGNEKSRGKFSDFGFWIISKEKGYSFDEVSTVIDEYVFFRDGDECGGVFSWTGFAKDLRARFIDGAGWYSRDDIKFILSEWSSHLGSECDDSREYENLSVEHVLPQNQNSEGAWAEVRLELGRRFEYVLHDLGNLTLLAKGANLAVQDIDLKSKAGVYVHTADGADILRRAGRNCKWTETEIIERGRSIVKFMVERWEFPEEGEDPYVDDKCDDVLSKGVKPLRQRKHSPE